MELTNLPLFVTASIALISFVYTMVNHSKNSFKEEYKDYQNVLVYFYLELMNIYTGQKYDKYKKARELIDAIFEKEVNITLLINQYSAILDLKNKSIINEEKFIEKFDNLAINIEGLYWEWYFENQLENVVSQKWHAKVKYKFQWVLIKLSSILKFFVIGFYVGFFMLLIGLAMNIYLVYMGLDLTENQKYIGDMAVIIGASIFISSIGVMLQIATEKNLREKYIKEKFTRYITSQIEDAKKQIEHDKLELEA